ncbi:MAG: zinc ABC transporter substrate-binding protein [Gemmatimonadetes bacterium]|nr:zinc ABC transporter substrate-binding protein [Gemmatimonadota bacterium]MCK5483763.1 zinc ABC transporter substrate-binding protein [Gemmatimonadota bacterium]
MIVDRMVELLLPSMAALAVAAPQAPNRSLAVTVPAPDPPRVVTSLTTYASIARKIVGERGEVEAIANGAENPHFVTPRPSLVLMLRKADMFVVTGLDLELWIPAIEDKANNSRVRPGAIGYVTASTGLELLDVPTSVSRTAGDIHAFGNPHIWTSPVNAITIGANILAGLQRVAPENASYYEQRYAAWKDRILRALAGDELVELLGPDAVFELARGHRLIEFLESQTYEGVPLMDRLGGWLERAEVFRGGHMVCYHKEWDYFSRAFGVTCDAYVEPKPGIPPTPRHVADVIELMKRRHLHVLFSTNYFDRNQVMAVADRTNATAVIVPSNTHGAPGIETYEDLVDLWVGDLATAFEQAGR